MTKKTKKRTSKKFIPWDEKLRTYQAGQLKMYEIDKVIANRIKQLILGLDGEPRHTWRALAIRIVGYECQITGKDLSQVAQFTLKEDWDD